MIDTVGVNEFSKKIDLSEVPWCGVCLLPTAHCALYGSAVFHARGICLQLTVIFFRSCVSCTNCFFRPFVMFVAFCPMWVACKRPVLRKWCKPRRSMSTSSDTLCNGELLFHNIPSAIPLGDARIATMSYPLLSLTCVWFSMSYTTVLPVVQLKRVATASNPTIPVCFIQHISFSP